MIDRLALLLSLIFLSLIASCSQPASSQSTQTVPKVSPSPSPAAEAPGPDPEQLVDIYLDKDKVLHRGYEVRRLKKTINYEYGDQSKPSSNPVEISYAVIKRNGKVVAQFNGPYFSAGNFTDFGLFDFLGDGSQELIVSTTVFRGGSHWVVSFVPEFSVLFDSEEFGVGREEFCVVDIDKDGIYEISLPVTAFYEMQDKMYIGEIPLPEIIFKYDPRKKKYLPANGLYLDYTMRGLDEEMRKLDQEGNYLSRRLRILLRYIYAGREDEGWAFFDSAYQQPDKVEIKARIQSVLNLQPVYKYLKAPRGAEPLKHHLRY